MFIVFRENGTIQVMGIIRYLHGSLLNRQIIQFQENRSPAGGKSVQAILQNEIYR